MARALGGTVEPTGGYEFGLRKIWITKQGSQDPVFSKLRVPLVPTLHGECFSCPARRNRARFRIHALPRRNIPTTEPRLPSRQLLRIPVRTPTNPRRIENLEPRISERLRTDGSAIRSQIRSRREPQRVRHLLPDLRIPIPRHAHRIPR